MKWISIITHTILFAGLIVLLGFTSMRHDEKKCTDYRVDLGVQESKIGAEHTRKFAILPASNVPN